MALTFTISDLERVSAGSKAVVYGTATLSGTTTDNGDSFTAAIVGLSRIEQLEFQPSVDSLTNPENVFGLAPIKASDSTWKVVVYTAHGTPGATVPFLVITDGTAVTFIARFTAWGLA